MSLSERLRPDVECAPWVIEEVKLLEKEVERLSKVDVEPVAWWNPREPFAPEAIIWSQDSRHPEYDTPLYPAPALAAEKAKVRELVGLLEYPAKYFEANADSADEFDTLTKLRAAIAKYGEQK